MQPRVDFGIKKGAARSASKGSEAVSPFSVPTVTAEDEATPLHYFYSSIPQTNFVLPVPHDRRFGLGTEIKHWLITKDPVEIDYIRKNFSPEVVARMGRDASSIVIEEKTLEEYEDYLGLTATNAQEQQRSDPRIQTGSATPLPPITGNYPGMPHPTLAERLAASGGEGGVDSLD